MNQLCAERPVPLRNSCFCPDMSVHDFIRFSLQRDGSVRVWLKYNTMLHQTFICFCLILHSHQKVKLS